MKRKKNIGLIKKTHNGIDRIMDKAESIGESSKKRLDSLKEKSLMMKNNYEDYIQKNPEKLILIGTGVGIIIGITMALFLMRKKQSI
jgi:ElaB/YqjD/DUF883 family membrane-anchored ribosome-binding protein